MGINYSDYQGDMCCKCLESNLNRVSGTWFTNEEFYCEYKEQYRKWNSEPCSGHYKPDYSMSRIEAVDKALH